jgi:hypothetical protein
MTEITFFHNKKPPVAQENCLKDIFYCFDFGYFLPHFFQFDLYASIYGNYNDDYLILLTNTAHSKSTRTCSGCSSSFACTLSAEKIEFVLLIKVEGRVKLNVLD